MKSGISEPRPAPLNVNTRWGGILAPRPVPLSVNGCRGESLLSEVLSVPPHGPPDTRIPNPSSHYRDPIWKDRHGFHWATTEVSPGWNWDLLLPYVLFAVHETLQALTGFTSFELFFGPWPRGLLDVAREAWEEQPSSFRSVTDFMEDSTHHKGPHGGRTTGTAKDLYPPRTTLRVQIRWPCVTLNPQCCLQISGKVAGPYTVQERVGPVNYHLQQLGKCADTTLSQKSLEVMECASLITNPQEHALVKRGDDLTPAQHQEITKLIDQFTDK